MTTTTPEKLLTPEQLAEHLQVPFDRSFWRLVDEEGIPFLYAGRGTARKGGRGQRGNYRFRPSAIAAWERGREKTFTTNQGEEKKAPATATIAKLHDGNDRGGRKGKKGPRAK
jgi:hypothetical protein